LLYIRCVAFVAAPKAMAYETFGGGAGSIGPSRTGITREPRALPGIRVVK